MLNKTWSDLNVTGSQSPEAKYSKPPRAKNNLRMNRLWMFVMSLTFFAILVVVSAIEDAEMTEPVEIGPGKLPMSFLKQAKDISEYVQGLVINDTIILTYASYGYRANLVNWIISLTRLEISNFAIVCLDKELDEFLSARNLPCYQLWKYDGADFSTQSKGHSSSSRSKHSAKLSLNKVKQLWAIRLGHLRRLLQAGINVIFSDTDAIWIRNPIKAGVLSASTGDIVASRGQFPWTVSEAWGATICMGLAYFRSTAHVIKFVRRAELSSRRTGDDQVSINMAIFDYAKGQAAGYRLSQPNGVGFTKYTKLSYVNDKTIAVGTFDRARVVLLPHNVVPRLCNMIKESEWRSVVMIAHCHSKDGRIAKTHKNWGDFEVHANIQEKYKLWCLGDSQWESLRGKKFSEWLQVTSHSCSLPLS